MIIVGPNRKTKIVYAWQEGNGEFMVSPYAEVKGGRRPVGRFDSKEQVEAYAVNRGRELQWLTS